MEPQQETPIRANPAAAGEDTLERHDLDGGSGARLADFSIRYPVTICMVFVCLLTIGLISVWKIPLVLLPDADAPFLMVFVSYPNATPGQIQESITKPLEEALATIPGIQQMSSQSESDSAFVRMSFGFDKNIHAARAEVREKIDQIRGELPEDVQQIMVRNFSTSDIPIVFCAISANRNLRSSYDFLDVKLKKPLERIPGVADVELFGVDRKRVDIYLRADDVKRHKVRVDQLFRQIGGATTDRSLGRVEDGEVRYDAIARGTVSSIEEIGNLPVNGRGLRLVDIADVEYDTRPAVAGDHLNGQPGVGFIIRKASEANTVKTVSQVEEKLEEIRHDPAMQGVQIKIFRNAGDEIRKSLSGLLSAGVLGAILAVLVLIVFLRKLGAAMVISFSIPFCILSAVGLLYLCGYTLNTLTMMGLMLSSGMLVDNAVVVLESIYQNLEKGKERVEAARVGTQEVLTAVIAATLTSIIIFVPLIFGGATQFSIFFANAGASIIFALLASLFTSLTLIPLAMGRVLRLEVRERSKWQQWLAERSRPIILRLGRLLFRKERGAGAVGGGPSDGAPGARRGRHTLTDRYLQLVTWPLDHRLLVGVLIVPLIIAGSVWVLMNKVPDNTPDAQELQELQVQFEFSENFHYAKIERDYLIPVEQFLLNNKERFRITDISSSYSNNRARTEVYFDTDRITLEEMQSIRDQMSEGLPVIPGAKIRLGRQEGAQNENWISANISGDDPQILAQLAAEARRRLLQNPDFSDVYTALDEGREEVRIRLNRALARKYNVSAQTVSRFLGIMVRAMRIGNYSTPEGEVEIWLQIHPRDLQDLADLKSLVVGSGPDGAEILLSQVAELTIDRTPARLEREDRRTYTRVNAVFTGDKRNEGMAAFSKVMDSLDYPRDYEWTYGFWTRRQSRDQGTFVFNLLLALFMVYFVMASLFESLAHPFAIILSLPFAAVGVAWFLLLTWTPFNMMSMIGMLVLIGVVVNNGIVLIDHVNNLRRRGLPRRQAILGGCRERLRPILMTASTTVVGLIPLAWGDGGLFSMKYFPLARTVMGGLIASTALTLVVLPTYYSLFDDLAIWIKRTWFASDPSVARRPLDAPASGD